MRTHVHVTPDIDKRAADWLDEPFPDDPEALEEARRDIDVILGRRSQPVALVEELEAAE